ncbi:hypothetical protein [Aquipuribacter nitratireducens]|uniref:Uncharacterized protein n=1 Tax=Aquipuribacter nitratireducens TaxID=650104 RepID=A0ABW0GMR0_9MICO
MSALAIVLLVGVVVVRGESPVGDTTLAAPPTTGPTPSASPAPPDVDAVELTANGVPLLRLGAAPGTGVEVPPGDGPDPRPPALRHCDFAYLSGIDATTTGTTTGPESAVLRLGSRHSVTAWTVGGRVEGLTVQAWDRPEAPDPVLATWLGVTIGSPMSDAAALPGARTERVRPWPEQPAVTVVRVPLRGGGTELVVGDATPFEDSDSPDDVPARGRVSRLVLQTATGRSCAEESAVWESTRPAGDAPVTVTDVGVDGIRPGADATALVAAGVLDDAGEAFDSCEQRESAAHPGVRALVRDGTVVRVFLPDPVEVAGTRLSGLTLRELLESPVADLVSADPGVPGQSLGEGGTSWGQPVYLHVADGVVLEASLQPGWRPVNGLGSSLAGGPLRLQAGTLVDDDPYSVDC